MAAPLPPLTPQRPNSKEQVPALIHVSIEIHLLHLPRCASLLLSASCRSATQNVSTLILVDYPFIFVDVGNDHHLLLRHPFLLTCIVTLIPVGSCLSLITVVAIAG